MSQTLQVKTTASFRPPVWEPGMSGKIGGGAAAAADAVVVVVVVVVVGGDGGGDVVEKVR